MAAVESFIVPLDDVSKSYPTASMNTKQRALHDFVKKAFVFADGDKKQQPLADGVAHGLVERIVVNFKKHCFERPINSNCLATRECGCDAESFDVDFKKKQNIFRLRGKAKDFDAYKSEALAPVIDANDHLILHNILEFCQKRFQPQSTGWF